METQSSSKYSIVVLPFSGPARERSKNELKKFLEWYIAAIGERVAVLAQSVCSTPEFGDWKPDYSPFSLGFLSDWLTTQIETRKRSSREVSSILDTTPWLENHIGDELSEKTYSIAFDVSIYFGEVLLRNNAELERKQELRYRRDINYGMPVIVGANPIPLNPMNPVLIFVRAIADEQEPTEKLDKSYSECLDFLAHK